MKKRSWLRASSAKSSSCVKPAMNSSTCSCSARRNGASLVCGAQVLARHDRQAQHHLADQELAVDVVATDLDHHRSQHLDAFLDERLLGDVDRADRAGAHRARRVEAHVKLVRRLAVAFVEGLQHFLFRHRRHVFVEHRELRGDLLGQEVGVGRSRLRHLDEEGPELADHLRHDLRLRREILRVGLEERADVADRLDLPAHDGDVAADQLRATQELVELPLIEAPPCLEQVHHLHQQRLVGADHQPHHVERQLAQALELG